MLGEKKINLVTKMHENARILLKPCTQEGAKAVFLGIGT